jgi:hypothetical protein
VYIDGKVLHYQKEQTSIFIYRLDGKTPIDLEYLSKN